MLHRERFDRFAWTSLQVARRYAVAELLGSRNLLLRGAERFCCDGSPTARVLAATHLSQSVWVMFSS